MAKAFLSDVDLKAGLLLNGSAGTSGYVLKSQGAGQNPIWSVDSANGPIMQTALVVSENVTLNANSKAYSADTIEIASGYSVTVPSTTTWIVTSAFFPA